MSDEEDQNEAENEEVDVPPVDLDDDEGGGKKKLLLILVPLILIGAGAGLYFTGMLDSVLGGGSSAEHSEDSHGDDHASDDHGDGHDDGHGGASGAFIEIPTMIVNLSEEDGTPRYLRLTVQLEMKNPADTSKIEAVMPRVVDQFQTYLRELRVKDLRGSAGIYRLQMELLWRVNQAASPIEVKDVLFQEILIQ